MFDIDFVWGCRYFDVDAISLLCRLADGCARLCWQLSYAIGVAEPLSIFVSSYGTGVKSDEDLLKIIKNNFDLRPGRIVRYAAPT